MELIVMSNQQLCIPDSWLQIPANNSQTHQLHDYVIITAGQRDTHKDIFIQTHVV